MFLIILMMLIMFMVLRVPTAPTTSRMRFSCCCLSCRYPTCRVSTVSPAQSQQHRHSNNTHTHTTETLPAHMLVLMCLCCTVWRIDYCRLSAKHFIMCCCNRQKMFKYKNRFQNILICNDPHAICVSNSILWWAELTNQMFLCHVQSWTKNRKSLC